MRRLCFHHEPRADTAIALTMEPSLCAHTPRAKGIFLLIPSPAPTLLLQVPSREAPRAPFPPPLEAPTQSPVAPARFYVCRRIPVLWQGRGLDMRQG